MKKGVLLAAVLVIIFILSSNVESKIFFDETLSLYNLGQKINMNTKVLSFEDIDGYFKLNLVCNDRGHIKEQIIYFSPVTLEKNNEKEFAVSFQILNKGACYFEADLENVKHEVVETAKTSVFTSTDLINIGLELNKLFLLPGEELEMVGRAVKANGDAINGIGSFTLQHITNGTSQEIMSGDFSVKNSDYNYKITLPDNISPGEKELKVSIEDSFGNKGLVSETITIASVPTELFLELSGGKESDPTLFLPGRVMTIKAEVLDQVGNVMEKDISLKIEAGKKTIHEEIIKSGESTIYKIDNKETAGEYKLTVYSEGLETKKTFYIAEFKEVSIELEDDILHVINIGNVPYQSPLEVSFSKDNVTETKIVDINLGVGEEAFIKLEAPTGDYEVSIQGTEIKETLRFGNVPLTGQVTAALELGENKAKDILILVLASIIFLGCLAFIAFRKREWKFKMPIKIPKKKNKVEIEKIKEEPKKKVLDREDFEKMDEVEEIETKTGKIQLASEGSKARLIKERSLLAETEDDFSRTVKNIFSQHSHKTGAKAMVPGLIFGEKRPITALFVRIDGLRALDTLRKKNPNAFEKILNDYFSTIIDKIRSHMGIAEIYNNNILVIFNAIKQYSHDLSAIKTASEIRDETMKFNERYKNIAELHVAAGINTGNAILSTITENKILKYLSLENTTYIAKQLENKANSDEIIISENTYEKLKNSLDAKKLSPLFVSKDKAIENYSIGQLSLRAKYKDYVDRVVREYKKQKEYY